jgi:hypothetical protein
MLVVSSFTADVRKHAGLDANARATTSPALSCVCVKEAAHNKVTPDNNERSRIRTLNDFLSTNGGGMK